MCWKKKLKLAPGYSILILWILFTPASLGRAPLASFSTTKEMFSDRLLDSGSHIGNYVEAWVSSNVSTIFFSPLFYAVVSHTLLILTRALAAHALSRFGFVCNKLVQLSFVAFVNIPAVVIVLSLFAVVAGLNIFNNVPANRAALIFLYIGINVSYTIILLITFFTNLPRASEETVATNGYPPVKTFWLIMLSVAQPGITTVTIFNLINIWNEYPTSLIFGNSDKVCPVAVGPYSMINSMKYTGDWAGMPLAVAIVFLPTLTLYIFLLEKIIAGVTGGGMKGQDRTGNVKE